MNEEIEQATSSGSEHKTVKARLRENRLVHRIYMTMHERNLLLNEVAKEVKLSTQYLSNLLGGHKSFSSLEVETIRRIADFVRVTPFTAMCWSEMFALSDLLPANFNDDDMLAIFNKIIEVPIGASMLSHLKEDDWLALPRNVQISMVYLCSISTGNSFLPELATGKDYLDRDALSEIIPEEFITDSKLANAVLYKMYRLGKTRIDLSDELSISGNTLNKLLSNANSSNQLNAINLNKIAEWLSVSRVQVYLWGNILAEEDIFQFEGYAYVFENSFDVMALLAANHATPLLATPSIAESKALPNNVKKTYIRLIANYMLKFAG